MIRRPPRSTQSRSSAASDVYKRQVENGIAPYDQTHALFGLLGLLGWISLFLLGPIGIVIAGRSAGVRGALAWLALLMWALPVFAFVWFVCVASLSGALGNPF